MTDEEGGAEFQELQRKFAGHAAQAERERQESYERFEDLGEAEVDRRVHLGEWLNHPDAPLMQSRAVKFSNKMPYERSNNTPRRYAAPLSRGEFSRFERRHERSD